MIESKADFARRKGWNKSTVTRYAALGKIVTTADGKIDVEASEELLAAAADPTREGVRLHHARERLARGVDPRANVGRQVSPASSRGDPSDSSYLLLQKHRAAAEAERAAMLRMQREEMEGRLVDEAAVRRRAHDSARRARNSILNLRFRLDPILAGETDPVKRAEIWDRETRQICDELARNVGLAEATSATQE